MLTVAQLKVKLAEGWFDMAFSGDSGVIKRLMEKLGSLGKSDQYQYSYNPEDHTYTQLSGPGMKKGGKVKMSSASKRADGIAIRGKTRA